MPPPVEPDQISVDEGPMRRELLRQIAALERELSRLVSETCPWDPVVANPSRGPAMLSTADLEKIRDELLTASSVVHERIVTRATAGLFDEPEPRGGLLARLRRALFPRG